MNILAENLNKILKSTIADKLLSNYGKELFFPKGIVFQSEEAKKHASKYNATIGMACTNKKPMILSSIMNSMPDYDSTQMVSYAPTPGIAELRSKWATMAEEKNPSLKGVETTLPMVVPGLTAGLSVIAEMFLTAEDNIIIPDMFWGNYRLMFEVKQEGHIVDFPFFNAAGEFNCEAFEKTVLENTVNNKIVILLNFPNNPTGYTPTKTEVKKLKEAMYKIADSGINMLILTDDAYFGLFYEEEVFTESVFSQVANLHPNILAVKIDGATKEDFIWGFRVGFVTFASKGLNKDHLNALEQKLKGAIRGTFSNSTRPGQEMLLKALNAPSYKEEKLKLGQDLKSRYKKVQLVVKKHQDSTILKALPFNSGYFMAFEVLGGSAEDLRKELLLKENIGTISIKERYLRIAYASINLEDIEDLYEIIFQTAERMFA